MFCCERTNHAIPEFNKGRSILEGRKVMIAFMGVKLHLTRNELHSWAENVYTSGSCGRFTIRWSTTWFRFHCWEQRNG